MKTFIYVDGENLFYQVVNVLVQEKKIRTRYELTKFDLRWLLCEAVRLKDKPKRIRYYGTRLHLVKDMGKAAYDKSLRMIQHKRAWGEWLHDQDIDFVTAGNLKPRQQGRSVNFQEKGVDVRLAVDLVQDAFYGTAMNLVVVSSDSDLVPALQAAKAHKQKITYVAFAETINKALTFNASQTLTFTRDDIITAFERAQKHGR